MIIGSVEGCWEVAFLGKLRVYLDNCCYNRPFDDMTADKIRVETVAKLFIQDLITDKKAVLAYSFMSLMEIADNPNDEIKVQVLKYVENMATIFVGIAEILEVNRLKDEIMRTGIKHKDATHLACAMLADCEYFITVDKRILKYKSDKIKPVNPIEFAEIWRNLQ